MARGRGSPAGRLEERPEISQEGNPEEIGGDDIPTLFDFTGAGRCRLLRKDDRSQRMTPHGFFPVDVTEEAILKEYGGGHYRVQLLLPDEQGREVIKRSRDVHLPGPYKPPTGELPGIGSRDPLTPKAPSTAVAVAAPANGHAAPQVNEILSAGVLQLFQASATQQQMMAQMFQQAQQAQSALLQAILTRGSNAPDFAAILTAVTPILHEFLKRPKEERDPLEMLRAVGEIVRSNTGNSNQVADTLASIREILELKNELSPPGGGTGDPLVDSLPRLAEALYQGVQMQKEKGQTRRMPPAPPAQPALPNPNVPAATPVAEEVVQQENVPLWRIVLHKEGPRLVQQAAQGRAAGMVAMLAVEFAPANVKGALIEFTHRDTDAVLADLLVEVPGLQQYPNWALEFVESVQDILFPGEYDEPDDEQEEKTEESGDGD